MTEAHEAKRSEPSLFSGARGAEPPEHDNAFDDTPTLHLQEKPTLQRVVVKDLLEEMQREDPTIVAPTGYSATFLSSKSLEDSGEQATLPRFARALHFDPLLPTEREEEEEPAPTTQRLTPPVPSSVPPAPTSQHLPLLPPPSLAVPASLALSPPPVRPIPRAEWAAALQQSSQSSSYRIPEPIEPLPSSAPAPAACGVHPWVHIAAAIALGAMLSIVVLLSMSEVRDRLFHG